MFKSLITAAALTLGLATAAVAVPAAPGSQPGATSGVIQVKKDWDRGDWKKWNKKKNWKSGKNRNYKHYGHGYRNPPRGWNRYAGRPWGWERRGCIVIGPAWYCP